MEKLVLYLVIYSNFTLFLLFPLFLLFLLPYTFLEGVLNVDPKVGHIPYISRQVASVDIRGDMAVREVGYPVANLYPHLSLNACISTIYW